MPLYWRRGRHGWERRNVDTWAGLNRTGLHVTCASTRQTLTVTGPDGVGDRGGVGGGISRSARRQRRSRQPPRSGPTLTSSRTPIGTALGLGSGARKSSAVGVGHPLPVPAIHFAQLLHT